MNDTTNNLQFGHPALRDDFELFAPCCGDAKRHPFACRLTMMCCTHGPLCVGLHD